MAARFNVGRIAGRLLVLGCIVPFIFFRKDYAKIEVGPAFIFEVSVLVLVAWAVARCKFRVRSIRRFGFLPIVPLFIACYSLGVAFWYSDYIPLEMVIGVYPVYFFLGVLIALLSRDIDYIALQKGLQSAFLWYPPIATVLSFSPVLDINLLRNAGNTIVLPISLMLGLKNYNDGAGPGKLVFAFAPIIAILAQDQRQTVLTSAVLAILYSVISGHIRQLFYFVTFAIFGIFLFFQFFQFFEFRGYRYQSLEQFVDWILSIFGAADVGAGTRGHRLEMWSYVMGVLLDGFKTSDLRFYFGYGYSDIISGAQFRSIHNGYITFLYRNGIFCFLAFVFFWMRLLGGFWSNRKRFLLPIAMIVSILLDAVTGTGLDQPFLSGPFYLVLGLFWYEQRTLRARLAADTGAAASALEQSALAICKEPKFLSVSVDGQTRPFNGKSA